MSDPLYITKETLLDAIAGIDTTNKLVDKLGFAEVLRSLSVIAETNARFVEWDYPDDDLKFEHQGRWRKTAKRLLKMSERIASLPAPTPRQRGNK